VRLLVEHVDRARLGWLAEAAEGCTLVSRLMESHIERHLGSERDVAMPVARGERPGVGAGFNERIGQYRRPLYLFGAGHVGQAVAAHAERLPLRLAWFDTRPEFESIPGVTLIAEESLELCVAEAPDDAAIAILTHDHGIDYRLTMAALTRPPVAFVGLIGSGTKRARFLSRLAQDGVAADSITRLTCPIGIEGVHGKEPDIIAIATLAQVLQLELQL
jgi:xanthine dehydrogenase accessory factor